MYSEAGFWNSEMATMKKTVKKPMLRPMYMIVPTVFTLTDFGKPCKGPKGILDSFSSSSNFTNFIFDNKTASVFAKVLKVLMMLFAQLHQINPINASTIDIC